MAVAAAVVDHLESCWIRCFQLPPVPTHGTPDPGPEQQARFSGHGRGWDFAASARQSDAIKDPAQSLEALSAPRNCLSAAAAVRGVDVSGKAPAPRFANVKFAAANFPTSRTSPDTLPRTFTTCRTRMAASRLYATVAREWKPNQAPEPPAVSKEFATANFSWRADPQPAPGIGPVAFCQKRRRLAGRSWTRTPVTRAMRVGQASIRCAKTGAGLNPAPRTAQVERCLHVRNGTP